MQKAENFSVGAEGKWENGGRRYENKCVCWRGHARVWYYHTVKRLKNISTEKF